jgi:hypothetical protein
MNLSGALLLIVYCGICGKGINECSYCNNFFIARGLKKTRCYPNECDKAYRDVGNGKKRRIIQSDIYKCPSNL